MFFVLNAPANAAHTGKLLRDTYFSHEEVEVTFIFFVYETIVKYTKAFVVEQSQYLDILSEIARVGLKGSLNAFGEISQVEDVVRLSRSRQKID